MQLHCPHCQGIVEVHDQMAGQICQCPLCSGQFSVPKPQPRAMAASSGSRKGSASASQARPRRRATSVIVAALLLACAASAAFFAWRHFHANPSKAFVVPAGKSITTGLALTPVTLRIPPWHPGFREPPDFITEEMVPPGMTFEAYSKKLEDDAEKKFQEDVKRRTHEASMTIHLFKNGAGDLPLGTQRSEAPVAVQLLDRFCSVAQAQGWEGAKEFLTPEFRAEIEREIKSHADVQTFQSMFAKEHPVAVLFAAELAGHLFVATRLTGGWPMAFHVSKRGDECFLGDPGEISQETATLIYDLGWALLKNGNSIEPLMVK